MTHFVNFATLKYADFLEQYSTLQISALKTLICEFENKLSNMKKRKLLLLLSQYDVVNAPDLSVCLKSIAQQGLQDELQLALEFHRSLLDKGVPSEDIIFFILKSLLTEKRKRVPMRAIVAFIDKESNYIDDSCVKLSSEQKKRLQLFLDLILNYGILRLLLIYMHLEVQAIAYEDVKLPKSRNISVLAKSIFRTLSHIIPMKQANNLVTSGYSLFIFRAAEYFSPKKIPQTMRQRLQHCFKAHVNNIRRYSKVKTFLCFVFFVLIWILYRFFVDVYF